jgi:hypothetical protein
MITEINKVDNWWGKIGEEKRQEILRDHYFCTDDEEDINVDEAWRDFKDSTKKDIYKYWNNDIVKITVTRKINSYTGKDGWGFDCVEGSDGNIYHVKQEPNSNWKTGDDITRAKKTKE